jgi:hypothetical protein
MPDPAPVTMAVLPSNSCFIFIPFLELIDVGAGPAPGAGLRNAKLRAAADGLREPTLVGIQPGRAKARKPQPM